MISPLLAHGHPYKQYLNWVDLNLNPLNTVLCLGDFFCFKFSKLF